MMSKENRKKLQDILNMIEIFMQRKDRSISFVNKIEVILDDFADEELFEQYRVALACYRPGGGEFLYDENQMESMLRTFKYEIEERLRLEP